MENVGYSRLSNSYHRPRAGLHRSRSKSDLTVKKISEKANLSLINRFIQKIREMEQDFAEIRARELKQVEVQKEAPDSEITEKFAFLRRRLLKITDLKCLPTEELNQTLERIKDLTPMACNLEEYKSLLKAQIDYVTDDLGRGYIRYQDPETKQPGDLLDYVNLLAVTPVGLDVLTCDKEMFHLYGNVQILSISKKLALLYPRHENHEEQFADLINAITFIYEKKVETTTEELGNLTMALCKLNQTIQRCFDESIVEIRKELSLLSRPDGHVNLAPFEIQSYNLLNNDPLVDEKVRESKKSALGYILEEIVRTEEAFGRNVGVIADSQLFAALAKEGVITIEELAILRQGWKKLHLSSLRLRDRLAQGTTLVERFSSFLGGFSPEYLDEHMENCKVVIGNYFEGNKIILRIEGNATAKQMLIGFAAMHRLDLKDLWIMPTQRAPRYPLLIKEVMKIMEHPEIAKRVDYLEKWTRAINFFAPDFSK